MSAPAKSSPLPLPLLLWLSLGLCMVAAPHTLRLPWWVNGTVAALLVWRIYLGWQQAEMPRRWLLLLLALGQLVGVYFTFRTIFGRDAGVTLLVLLLALKLMETRAHRDVFVVIFLAYFVTLTNFFYSQTIPTGVYTVLTVLAITAALIGFNARARPMFDNLGTAGWMLAQAAPVMLLLFFLFPRVQGPLWGMPQDAYGGVTGLSDTMSPGSISRLSQSDAIAFRAKFEGARPPNNELYWRGPVLWHFDGQTWRTADPRLRYDIRYQAEGSPIDYEVTLEPHNRHWLYALDLPGRLPANARATTDYQLISLVPVRTRMRYEMRSYPKYRATGGSERQELTEALALPEGFNPRALRLAREWRAASPKNDAAVVRAAIQYFRTNGFVYTLEPALLGRDTVDEFLFDTKEGFCEHYASSFVVLMRAAGIPARVVTGYQGGGLNPVDNYMVVRESDAHAWAEVWLGEAGWVRIDPTAAAVPIRVERGIAEAVSQSGALPMMIRQRLEWLRSIRNSWEALANQWNQWVLGYNPDRQREMLSWLGMQQPSWQSMAILLFWSVAAVMLATGLWLLFRMRRESGVQRAWLRFCAKLARAGLERGVSEGPLHYARRAAGRLPQRADSIRAIAELYVELRYGPGAAREHVFLFRGLVRGFRP
jgi:transglutaminase-like putative cysteine protease